ncbi:MAG: CYTH domain-containing protein [Gammaproteobacteria bacterium]|jgi:adenylate cyclase|nr:CYTH domain-containing protein [Gammaproteobacteria bacterium]
MGTEIERKFLLQSDDWRNEVKESTRLVQGYLLRGDKSAVRVRIKDDVAELNIKHTQNGINRLEYEYEIPVADAREILDEIALKPLIDKTRHHVVHDGHLWEIDEFYGENAGLVVAEIELARADEPFEKPAWLGQEVSLDQRYYNSNLSKLPYTQW